MKKFYLSFLFVAAYGNIIIAQNIYTVPSTANNLGIIDGNTAVDSAGNLYIPDWSNSLIRKVDIATGLMTIIAGTGTPGYNGDGILASTAQLNYPEALAVDMAGNIYIAEYSENRIRKIDASTGLISTIAGTGVAGYNGDNISATTAQIIDPTSVALDTAGNVYFTELGARVRKITKSTGLISTIAGTGVQGYNGDNILANTAQLKFPYGIALDKAGNIYIADQGNNRVRKVNVSTGMISTFSGTGIAGYNGDGISADTARLNDPWGIAVDINDNVYVAESSGFRIRKINASGIITTVAGNGNNGGLGDGGLATLAELTTPRGLSFDACNNMYISEHGSYKIRKVTVYDVSISSTNVLCKNICNGVVTANATGGAGSYSYIWDGGLGSGANHTNACASTYRVLVTDANNCKEDMYVTLTQPSAVLSVSTINVFDQVCLTGGGAGASVAGGTAPYSYSWSNGASTWSTNGLSAGNYTITVTDTNNCVASHSVTINNNPSIINVGISTVGATCSGNGSATASPSGGTPAYTYTWSGGGGNAATANGLTAGNYSVSVTDVNGCVGTGSVSVINNPYPSAPICMVTVDSASTHNIIMWDKTAFTNISYFIIMREIASNNYQPIATIPYDSLSEFIDTTQIMYFPNTGDPNSGTFRYKIKMVDTCGIYSTLSPYHNTIYFLNNNGTFYWTQPYTIENAANPVSSYILLRDDNSTGAWHAVSSVAGTQQVISDPLYSIYQNTGSWRVQTQWSISCTPTLRMQNGTQSAFSSSYSNVYSNTGIGIKNNLNENSVSLYPSPNNGSFTVETASLKNVRLEMYNIFGELVYKADLKKEKNQILTEGLSKGTYLTYILSDSGRTIKRIIVE